MSSAQSPADDEWQSVLRCLPAPVALAASRWLAASHPLARLMRMVGTFEALLTLATLLALADLVRRLKGQLPDGLRRSLGPSLRDPSLGVWLEVLRQLLAEHGRRRLGHAPASAATRCARDLLEQSLLPVLGGDSSDPDQGLRALRNRVLAHNTASPSDEQYRRWLEEGGHEARAQGALRAARTAWLPLRLAYVERQGRVRLLEGPEAAPGPEEDVPEALHAQLASLVGGVVVLQPAPDPVLELGPFVALAQAPPAPLPRPRPAEGAQLETYSRLGSSGGSIGYSRLGLPPYVERGGRALDQFRALFPAMFPEGRARERDFLDELRRDAQLHIGREDLVAAARERLRAATTGTFWLAGGPGAGKSTFVARVVDDPAFLEAADRLVVVHRFRRGDARASLASFLYGAVDQLAEWLPRLLPKARREGAKTRPGRPEGPSDLPALRDRLRELLALVREARAHAGAAAGGAAARVLFVLDGLDEIAASEPGILDLPVTFAAPGVVWLCVGRDEGEVSARLGEAACLLQTPGGEGLRRLPGLSRDDVRAILYDGLTPELREALFLLDQQGPTGAQNPVVERLCSLPDGHAQYLRLLVDDLRRGRITPEAFARDPAPPSLSAYYADVWRGYGFGEDGALQQQALALLTQSGAPLSQPELSALLGFSAGRELTGGQQARVGAVLEACDSLFACLPAADGTIGRRFEHESARAHWARSHEVLAGQAAALLVRASEAPGDPLLGAAQNHLAEHGAAYLLAAGRPAAALRLLASLPLLLDRLVRAPASLVVAETLERMRQAQSAGADDADGAVSFLAEISQGVALGGAPVLLAAALREGSERAIGRDARAWVEAREAGGQPPAFLEPLAPAGPRRRLVRWTVHTPGGYLTDWVASAGDATGNAAGEVVLISAGDRVQAVEAATGRPCGATQPVGRAGRLVRWPGQGHLALAGSRLFRLRWTLPEGADWTLAHDASRPDIEFLDVLVTPPPHDAPTEAVLLWRDGVASVRAGRLRFDPDGAGERGELAAGPPFRWVDGLVLNAHLIDEGRAAITDAGRPLLHDALRGRRMGEVPHRTLGGALGFLGGGRLRRALLGLALPFAVAFLALAPGRPLLEPEYSLAGRLLFVAVVAGGVLGALYGGLPHRLATALLGRVYSACAAVPGRDGRSVWTSDGAGYVRWSLPRCGWWPFLPARMAILERRDGVPAPSRTVLVETALGGLVGYRWEPTGGYVLEHAAGGGAPCEDVLQLMQEPRWPVEVAGGRALALAGIGSYTVTCVDLPAGSSTPPDPVRARVVRLLAVSQLNAFALLRTDGTLELADARSGRILGAVALFRPNWRPREGAGAGEEGLFGRELREGGISQRVLSNAVLLDEQDSALRLWIRSHRWIWQSCSLRELHAGRARVKPWLFPGRVRLSLVRALLPPAPIELRSLGSHGRFEGRLWRDGALLRPMRAPWGDLSHWRLRWRADPLRPGHEYRMKGSPLLTEALVHGREPELTPLPTVADDGSARELCERSFEVSDDGEWVAECVERGPVLLRSGRTHEVVRVLEAQGPLAELSFSPRGRFLLTVNRHEPLVARLWEVASGRLVTTWADRTEIVLSDWLGDTVGLVTREGLHLLRLRGA